MRWFLWKKELCRKVCKHNSTIWTWLKKANSLRRYGKQNADGINGLIQSLGLDGLETENP